MGRWLTRDPIGYAGGENLYEYCAGNPVGHLDPLGLDLSIQVETNGNADKIFQQINDALAKLRLTAKGCEMLSKVEDQKDSKGNIIAKAPQDLLLLWDEKPAMATGEFKRDATGKVVSGTIRINPAVLAGFEMRMEDKTLKKAPLWRYLAHEMGHAVEGISGGVNDQPAENRCIQTVENVVARQLRDRLKRQYPKNKEKWNIPMRGDWGDGWYIR
jgi:hypothetical protein